MSNLQACNSPLANVFEFSTLQLLLQKYQEHIASGWARLLFWQTFPRELMDMDCNMQAPCPQGSNEACSGLTDIKQRLHQDGFLHWNDKFAASSLKVLQGLPNFAMGLTILRSILASAQLRDFLRTWFAPHEGPYIIGHCYYYTDSGTKGLPLSLRHNPRQSDRCLGLHILTADTTVRYYVKSQGENEAQAGVYWFHSSPASLENCTNETRSNGL